MIKVRGICKSYPKQGKVLTDVSFDVGERELVSIVGHSGSGKSTLLNILATLDEGTSGSYVFNGESISDHWKSHENLCRRWAHLFTKPFVHARLRRNMGFVFQTPFMLSNFTATYNIELAARIAGASLNASMELLIGLGLSGQKNKTSEKLSGGQRQRVAIGRALLHSPKVVFADEPTGNLDVRTAQEVMALLKVACVDSEAALVLITHSPQLAAEFSDRVVGLKDGEVKFERVIEDTREDRKCAHAEIKAFLLKEEQSILHPSELQTKT